MVAVFTFPFVLYTLIHWIMEKAREFQKNICFCFIDYARAFDCMDHNKLWKILKEMGIPDHLTCILRNLYAGQEATVRTGHGTTDWFQRGKGINVGLLCFHFCLSLGNFLISFSISSVIQWLFSIILYSCHMFVFLRGFFCNLFLIS